MERFFEKVIYEPTVFFETHDDVFGSMHIEQGITKTNIPEEDSLLPLTRELSSKGLVSLQNLLILQSFLIRTFQKI